MTIQFIQAQYRPLELEKNMSEIYRAVLDQPNDSSIVSHLNEEGTIAIWRAAKEDLGRLNYLKINNDTVVDFSISQTPTADEVANLLLEATKCEVEITQKLSKLLQQTWGGILVQLIMNIGSNVVSETLEQKHIVLVSTQDERFSVVHEVLFKVYHFGTNAVIDDETPSGYLKAKAEIKGSFIDLKTNNVKNLEFRLMNTQELKDENVARKESYGLNGWFNLYGYIPTSLFSTSNEISYIDPVI